MEQLASTVDSQIRKLNSLTGKKADSKTGLVRNAVIVAKSASAKTPFKAAASAPSPAPLGSAKRPAASQPDPAVPMKRPSKNQGTRVLQTPAKSLASVLPPVNAPAVHPSIGAPANRDTAKTRFCKLCKTDVNRSAATLRNHIMSEHIGDYRFTSTDLPCSLCSRLVPD